MLRQAQQDVLIEQDNFYDLLTTKGLDIVWVLAILAKHVLSLAGAAGAILERWPARARRWRSVAKAGVGGGITNSFVSLRKLEQPGFLAGYVLNLSFFVSQWPLELL